MHFNFQHTKVAEQLLVVGGWFVLVFFNNCKKKQHSSFFRYRTLLKGGVYIERILKFKKTFFAI